MAKFADLPIEIRLQIWQYTLLPPTKRPEIVVVTPRYFRCSYPHFARTAPSVFQVCYESRMVAFEYMVKVRTDDNFLNWNVDFDAPGFKSKNFMSTFYEVQRYSYIQPWFDFDHDKLYLRHLGFLHSHSESLRLIAYEDAIRISNLVIDLIDVSQILYGREYLPSYEGVKTLTVVLPDGFDEPLRTTFCALKDMCKSPHTVHLTNLNVITRSIFDFCQAENRFHGFGVSGLVAMLEDRPVEVQTLSCWLFELLLRFSGWRSLYGWKWPEIELCIRGDLHPNAPMLTEDEQVAEDLDGFGSLSL